SNRNLAITFFNSNNWLSDTPAEKSFSNSACTLLSGGCTVMFAIIASFSCFPLIFLASQSLLRQSGGVKTVVVYKNKKSIGCFDGSFQPGRCRTAQPYRSCPIKAPHYTPYTAQWCWPCG